MEDITQVQNVMKNTGMIRTWDKLDMIRKIMLGPRLYRMCSAEGGAPEALIQARISQLNANGCVGCSLAEFKDLCDLSESSVPIETRQKRRFISDNVPTCLKRDEKNLLRFDRMNCNVLEDPAVPEIAAAAGPRAPLLPDLCPLCQGRFSLSQPSVTAPCGHSFHGGCLVDFLSSSTAFESCPKCRRRDIRFFMPRSQVKEYLAAKLRERKEGSELHTSYVNSRTQGLQRSLLNILRNIERLDEATKAQVLRAQELRQAVRAPEFTSFSAKSAADDLLDELMELDEWLLILNALNYLEQLELELTAYFSNPEVLLMLEVAPIPLSFTIGTYVDVITVLQSLAFRLLYHSADRNFASKGNAVRQLYMNLQERADQLEDVNHAIKAMILNRQL